MADSTVGALTAASALTGTELFYGVQSANDVKVTAAQIATFTGGGGGGMAIGGAVTGATLGSVLFVGTAGVWAQNNANFFWDATNRALKLGNASSLGAYYLNGVPALFEVPNVVNGNNWFDGNAGNFTLSGYLNFGTGDGALGLVSTGFQNTAMGAAALGSLTSGANNVAMGTNAAGNLTSGGSNFALGTSTLLNLTGSHGNNLAVGNFSLRLLTGGDNNVGLGSSTFGKLTGSASDNVAIGTQAGNEWLSGSANTVIGPYGGYSITSGSNNTLIGGWEGPSAGVSNVIALTDGRAVATNSSKIQGLDYNYTNAGVWSFQNLSNTIGLHVYNTTDGNASPTNYERGVFDWNIASNVLTIGTQKGGTGTLRPVNIIGSALTFNGSPIGGGGGMAIGGAVTGATSGSVLFADASGNLSQDTTFKYNATLDDLAIGGAYYVNAARALYVVPNVTENNWFEGNAGNATVSGYGNFGTGDNALLAVTSGYDNVAVGTNSMRKMTNGFQNFALGSGALAATLGDTNNTAIGTFALGALGNAGAGGGGNGQNVAIGFAALGAAEQAQGNIVVGYTAMNNVAAPTTATRNVVIGSQAGANLGIAAGAAAINFNTLIGPGAAFQLNGNSNSNTWLGGYQGTSGVLSNSICISEGGGAYALLDWHVTSPYAWTLGYSPALGIPPGLHIYNYQSTFGAASANYERVILDWNVAPYGIFRIASQAAGTGTVRLIAIDGFSKAGAPAAGDLPSGTYAVIDDTSGGQTWLCFNKAGTIRKVQLV